MATDIVIASAARTPIGSFNGAFGAVPAHDLGKAAIKGALERAKVKPEEVDEVIMGQILTGGQGQNPARQAAVNSGIPVEKTALGINQLCGSGLRAVAFGWQAIRNGDANIMVVGGQESMSQAPHVAHMRDGTKMGDLKMVDSMIKDGLWDAFNGYHMGNTAENVAQKYPDHPRRAGRLRRRLAEQGRGGAEVRPLQGRDRSGHGEDPQGRRRGRHRRVPAPRHDGRGAGQAAAGLHQGRRLGHGRQRLGHQRRRGGAGADERRRGQEARRDAARQDRVVGDHRRRSEGDGHRPGDGVAGGAEEGRLDGQGSRPRRGQRSFRRAGRWPSARSSASIPRSSTSTAARSRSAIRSAPRARAC